MKYYLFLTLLSLFGVACKQHCEQAPLASIDNKWKAWLADSAGTYNMVSSTGFRETFVGRKTAETTIHDYKGDKTVFSCIEGKYETIKTFHKSSINAYEFQVQLDGGPNISKMLISFQGMSFSWNLSNDTSISSSRNEVEKLSLDSLNVKGNVFYQIWKFTITKPSNLENHQAKIMYISQHYGLIRYEEASGIIWERE